jgi:hypothetical protein
MGKRVKEKHETRCALDSSILGVRAPMLRAVRAALVGLNGGAMYGLQKLLTDLQSA